MRRDVAATPVETRPVRSARRAVIATTLLWLWTVWGVALFKPGYSHASQFISELNASGTAFAWQAGWLGFVPFGLSILLLAWRATPLLPLRGIGRVGVWLVAAMEAGAWIGSAFAPCDVGCPIDGSGSTSQQLHNLLGGGTYLGTTLGVVLIAISPGLRAGSRLLLAMAVVLWFVLFGAMVDPAFANVRGVLQRAAEVILYGTLLATAWRSLPRMGAMGAATQASE